ncbi:MAG: hypothetical protein WC100_06385 [Sterolibacterium sp.]
MVRKQKLELTWIGKENRPKLEPHILLEDPAKSYQAKHRMTDQDMFDNLLGLKAAVAMAVTTLENDIFKYFTVHQRVAAI